MGGTLPSTGMWQGEVFAISDCLVLIILKLENSKADPILQVGYGYRLSGSVILKTIRLLFGFVTSLSPELRC